MLSGRISESVPVRQLPDTELRNENPQLAYHRTPPCNMYFIELNPPPRVAISNVPDSFYTSKLFTLKFQVMRKKSGFTIVEQAIVLVFEFEKVDFQRKTIHIRQSKYKKDRIVPLATSMAVGLKKYLKAENPHIWLFNGKDASGKYSVRGLSWVMRENLKKTSITKDVNLHSLRHSYATHLLEQGVNIVTLKELLGHADITTTMIYLHVAQCPLIKPHSPLDTLYKYPKNADKV
jgi:hypothetical protein